MSMDATQSTVRKKTKTKTIEHHARLYEAGLSNNLDG